MHPIRARRRRSVAVPVVVTAVAVLLGACSTPPTGADSFADGRQKVVDLVNESGAALPASAGFTPLTLADTDRELCHRKVLGYAAGDTGTRQPELTTIVELPEPSTPKQLLPAIGTAWERAGYRVDRSEFDNPHFPRLRARSGEYTVVATAFVDTPGFASRPRITLYAVGPCLR